MSLPLKIQHAQLSGASLAYRSVGKGHDVVLIHGLATSHGFWHLNVLLPMSRRFRVTLYDQRGHGSSSMPARGYTTAHLAGDLVELLDSLEIRRAHLVGHSVGGAVALHLAAEYPDRVASLVIADTRVRALQPRQRPADWVHWPGVKTKLAELGLELTDDLNEWGMHLLEKLAAPQFAGAREKLAGTSLFIPFSGLAGGQRSAQRWLELLDTTTARRELVEVAGLTVDRLSRIVCPVLAMYGEKSPTLPSLAGLAAVLRDCRSVIVGGAGHFFPIGCADRFVREVCDFLVSVDRVPTASLPPAASVIPIMSPNVVGPVAVSPDAVSEL